MRKSREFKPIDTLPGTAKRDLCEKAIPNAPRGSRMLVGWRGQERHTGEETPAWNKKTRKRDSPTLPMLAGGMDQENVTRRRVCVVLLPPCATACLMDNRSRLVDGGGIRFVARITFPLVHAQQGACGTLRLACEMSPAHRGDNHGGAIGGDDFRVATHICLHKKGKSVKEPSDAVNPLPVPAKPLNQHIPGSPARPPLGKHFH